MKEKAKAYDEAFERAKELLEVGLKDTRDKRVVLSFFPELKESEDEDILKGLISMCKTLGKTKWIAWLEKQGEHKKFRDSIQVGDKVTRNEDGVLVNLSQLNRVAKKDEKQREQKPTAWSEEDETTKNNISHIIRQYDKISKRGNQPCYYVGDCLLWMQNIKDRVQPKQEWSKEDAKTLNRISAILVDASEVKNWWKESRLIEREEMVRLTDFLKSFKDRYTWIPSEEQIKVCKAVYADLLSAKGFDVGTVNSELNRLEEDLKKLKG